ncbi:MAG: hypothetical protein M1830_002635 [Pleopsidium flavum]|nr:MAG: hypothetical protein M1830_002635 [Pleopsidium flavum]
MLDRSYRASTLTQTSAVSDRDTGSRPRSHDGLKKDMWSSMLDGVANGKRLPGKQLLVLGGTPDTEKEFLQSLSSDSSNTRRQTDRFARRTPPIATQFALGYTYQDVLDADHEDILARLSLYFLSEPSASFAALLKPLLTPKSLPECLIVILLDWTQPWAWLRQLRAWIRLLRDLLASLGDDAKEAMQEVVVDWRERRRGGLVASDGGGGMLGLRENVSIPLGPGEWDEALGVPICVVCQNEKPWRLLSGDCHCFLADKIEYLEKELGWREEDFDFVLQSLRTVLLKHGAALIYTTPSVSNSLQTLVHSTLGIQSLLKRPPLKHNVIDRDKVLVPSNWDSWGKIRVLREGFDVEGMSSSWSRDIQTSNHTLEEAPRESYGPDGATVGNGDSAHGDGEGGALAVFEDIIRDPNIDSVLSRTSPSSQRTGHLIEIEGLDTQEFLSGQVDVLESIKAGEDHGKAGKESKHDLSGRQVSSEESSRYRDSNRAVGDKGRVTEHIGPVQFNMGGIQVDADDMLKRLKDREASRNPDRDSQPSASPDGKSQNDALASFFAGLMKRGGNNSPKAPSN